MIATADIGAEVARLLVADWEGKKIVELGSPVSADDLARAMGEALGKPVTAQAIPRERWAATLESFGLPPGHDRSLRGDAGRVQLRLDRFRRARHGAGGRHDHGRPVLYGREKGTRRNLITQAQQG